MFTIIALEKDKTAWSHLQFWKRNRREEKVIGDSGYCILHLSERRFQKNGAKELLRALRELENLDMLYIEPFFRQYAEISIDISAYKELKTKNYFADYWDKLQKKLPKFLGMAAKDIAVAFVDEGLTYLSEKKLEQWAKGFGETYVYTGEIEKGEQWAQEIYEVCGAPVFMKALAEEKNRVRADAVFILESRNEVAVVGKLAFCPCDAPLHMIAGREVRSLQVEIPACWSAGLPSNFTVYEKLTALEHLFGKEFVGNFDIRC